MTDSQNNFSNPNGFHQNGVCGYTYNVTHLQQQIDFNNMSPKREMRPDFNRNTDLFHGNIGNNVMTTQTALMTDNQNNINNGLPPSKWSWRSTTTAS